MCTVTVVPCDGLVRIVHNRDELRTRPAALPPVELETERDNRLNKEAEERYKARKAGKAAARTARRG